jgi:hypothetical protein
VCRTRRTRALRKTQRAKRRERVDILQRGMRAKFVVVAE